MRNLNEDTELVYQGLHDRNIYAQVAMKYIEQYRKTQELLKQIEWLCRDINGSYTVCPYCEHRDYEGHEPDCKLAELLKDDNNE